MMINPFNDGIRTIEGTPFVQELALSDFIGMRVHSENPKRVWVIQGFLLPSRKRAIQGIRAQVRDQKGFVTFCNQRDLEVLLGLGLPGNMCHWLGRRYAAPGDEDWIGFHSAEDDLWDDLYERELCVRCDYPTIPEGTTVNRYVHLERGIDVEETWVCIKNNSTRYETVYHRWVRVERVRATWELV
jgi:hypothetical protein